MYSEGLETSNELLNYLVISPR